MENKILSVKTLLGDTAQNFTDAQIQICIEQAEGEIIAYCNRELDAELNMLALRIAILKLKRFNTEGLSSQGFSGVSESYIDGYPADILAILNRKRKIKII